MERRTSWNEDYFSGAEKEGLYTMGSIKEEEVAKRELDWGLDQAQENQENAQT